MSQRRSGDLTALSTYRDRQFQGSAKDQEEKLKASSTLYIGNLSFFTSEDQIYHLFSKAGDVKRVVMGLDRNTKTPCGFCFVEFYSREDAEDALRYVSGTRLDERIVRCDWDAGFIEGRQYGRGRSGGQVRDEFRVDYDAGRGGFGKMVQNRMDRFGADGGPPTQRRFEGRGKRKWQEVELDSQGEPITDLRQKLRRNNPTNPDGENVPTDISETPADGQETEASAATEGAAETAATEELFSADTETPLDTDTETPLTDENNGGEDVGLGSVENDLEMNEEPTEVNTEVEEDAEMAEDNGSLE